MFFRASLQPQGPREPPCVKERTILFRVALTRALYEQMAPQLCPFHVPETTGSEVFTGFNCVVIDFSACFVKVILGKIKFAGIGIWLSV